MRASLPCDNHGMVKPAKLIGGSAAVAVVALVLFLAGWSVRDAVASGHGDWASGISTLASWTGDAGKIALGALIGAVGAAIVARYNREEAREARFASRLRELTLQVMDDVIGMGLELMQQVAARAATGQPVDTSGLPKVRDTIAIRRAMLELDLTARSQAVSDAADELVRFLEQLRDEFAYVVARDMEIRMRPERQVLAKPLPSTARHDLQQRLTQLNEPYRRFQNAVRHDLGLPPLAEAKTPLPEEPFPQPSTVHRLGGR
jgi:hypothetical protein